MKKKYETHSTIEDDKIKCYGAMKIIEAFRDPMYCELMVKFGIDPDEAVKVQYDLIARINNKYGRDICEEKRKTHLRIV